MRLSRSEWDGAVTDIGAAIVAVGDGVAAAAGAGAGAGAVSSLEVRVVPDVVAVTAVVAAVLLGRPRRLLES